MLRKFYPRKTADSAYEVPYEAMYRTGIRGIIFDIDNTLVPHGAPADEKAIELFGRLRAVGMRTCLMSNNKEPRVRSFALRVGSEFIYKSGKPARRGYRKAMEKMETGAETTAFVGDQLFTDIYGANKAGIYSILVRPVHPSEEIQIRWKRKLESVVLFFYRRRLKRQGRQGQED